MNYIGFILLVYTAITVGVTVFSEKDFLHKER